MSSQYPFSPAVDRLIELALTEDLGCGDLTTDLLGVGDRPCRADVVAKQDLVVAGLDVLAAVFGRVDSEVVVSMEVSDGDQAGRGTVLATVHGLAASVLRGERVALNFARHLSGVATLTHLYVRIAGEDGPVICDTRKTTPGFRELEKYAVRVGGGRNHRFNLGAAVMIKDNHIAAVGSIAGAVRRVRRSKPHTATIEVETTTLEQVEEALRAGADIILLDNMTDAVMRQAVEMCRGRALTEASGGITAERIAALREVGVDVISSGALTHSAPAADISLDFHTAAPAARAPRAT